jgi:hypothetical protein
MRPRPGSPGPGEQADPIPDGCNGAESMRADEAVEDIRTAAKSHLATTPCSYRKVGQRPTLRELIVPFGSTGYVLRFDIRTPGWVVDIRARHQREDDFH